MGQISMAKCSSLDSLTKYLLLTCLFLFVLSPAFAGYNDWDQHTCAPRGLINIAKEKIDPKGFWISAYVEFSHAIDDPFVQSDMKGAHCFESNDEKQYDCLHRAEQFQAYIYRCLSHAQKKCRLNG